MDCIRNDADVPLEIHLEAFEFTWNCPKIQQPDFGTVHITYTPYERIVETKSLKFYLQQYRYKNAFNEELVNRLMMDFIYYVRPTKLRITLEQNSRGGIKNTCTSEWSTKEWGTWEEFLKGYKPKKTFQGGWPMVKGELKSEAQKGRDSKK